MTAIRRGGPFREVHLSAENLGSNGFPGGPGGPFSNPKQEKNFSLKQSDMTQKTKQDRYRKKVHLVHLRFKSVLQGPPSGGFSCVS